MTGEKLPEIGERRKGREVGYSPSNTQNYGWQACPDCGKERWVALRKDTSPVYRCHPCSLKSISGANSYNWKGGERRTSKGYIEVTLSPDSFFYSMKNKSHYVLEHRLIMAQHLGRSLHPWEIVHHKNNNKIDNRIENLQLVSDVGHRQLTILERRVERLEVKVEEQAKLIKLLQWQNKELSKKGIKNDPF